MDILSLILIGLITHVLTILVVTESQKQCTIQYGKWY